MVTQDIGFGLHKKDVNNLCVWRDVMCDGYSVLIWFCEVCFCEGVVV